MRIIRGEFVGKALLAPTSTLTRPTSDKVRQAIFNVIEHQVDMRDLRGSTVLDVFAGTGGLGLEALSRGAKHVTFVDNQ
ncbi:MAG: RsmD family RNA methyltransferase, partial [Alphaproteobacteria bacterium]|nr:RsmD family RNA methyltransferase [Alphaproteobacteria bacterium]